MKKEYKKKKNNIYLLTRANGSTPVTRESQIR